MVVSPGRRQIPSNISRTTFKKHTILWCKNYCSSFTITVIIIYINVLATRLWLVHFSAVTPNHSAISCNHSAINDKISLQGCTLRCVCVRCQRPPPRGTKSRKVGPHFTQNCKKPGLNMSWNWLPQIFLAN
jgi:hypothetical protein